jgi:hypothetical protein
MGAGRRAVDQPQPFTIEVVCGPFANGSNYDWG